MKIRIVAIVLLAGCSPKFAVDLPFGLGGLEAECQITHKAVEAAKKAAENGADSTAVVMAMVNVVDPDRVDGVRIAASPHPYHIGHIPPLTDQDIGRLAGVLVRTRTLRR